MKRQVLITGGARFIGSHLADELVKQSYGVRAFDNLMPQTHGGRFRRPDYLNPEVESIIGDVRDSEAIRRSLKNFDAVARNQATVARFDLCVVESGALNLLEALRALNDPPPLVFTSTNKA